MNTVVQINITVIFASFSFYDQMSQLCVKKNHFLRNVLVCRVLKKFLLAATSQFSTDQISLHAC